MNKQLYDVFLIEQYEKDGVVKNRYIQIGTGFPHKNGRGLNIRIKNGIAVSGEFSIFPRKDKLDLDDAEKNEILTLDDV